jgi:hypothetical protein
VGAKFAIKVRFPATVNEYEWFEDTTVPCSVQFENRKPAAGAAVTVAAAPSR